MRSSRARCCAQRPAGQDHGAAHRRGHGQAPLGRFVPARPERRPGASRRSGQGHCRRDRDPADAAGALAACREEDRQPGCLRGVPERTTSHGPIHGARHAEEPRVLSAGRGEAARLCPGLRGHRGCLRTVGRLRLQRALSEGGLPEGEGSGDAGRGARSDCSREPYASLAWSSFIFDRDWATAENQYQHALRLNPNYPTAHRSYAMFLSRMGRFDEAIREAKRAQELDPLSLEGNVGVGFAFYHARRDDEAIPWFRRVLDMDPSYWRAHWGLGLALAQKKRYDEAIAELRKAVELSAGGGAQLGSLGYAYAVANRRAEALEILEKLKESSRRALRAPRGRGPRLFRPGREGPGPGMARESQRGARSLGHGLQDRAHVRPTPVGPAIPRPRPPRGVELIALVPSTRLDATRS